MDLHTWTDHEIILLLKAWSERSIKGQLLDAVCKEVTLKKSLRSYTRLDTSGCTSRADTK